MPLMKGSSKKAMSHNIAAEMHSGKPQKQSIAIAYATARRNKKAKGGMIDKEKPSMKHVEGEDEEAKMQAEPAEGNPPMSARDRAIAAMEKHRKMMADGGDGTDAPASPDAPEGNVRMQQAMRNAFAEGGDIENEELDPEHEGGHTAKDLIKEVMHPLMDAHDIAKAILENRHPMNDGGLADEDDSDSLDDFLSHDDEEEGSSGLDDMEESEDNPSLNKDEMLRQIMAKVRARK